MYTAEGAMFEGLFVRALGVEPTSPVAARLRAAGFDLADVKPTYDIAVWADCVDVAWREVYPQCSRDEAWVKLGRRFIEGYFQTFVGGAIAAVLPYMDPVRFVERTPWFLRTGLGGSSSEVELTGARAAVLTLNGPHPRSALLLGGVLEVCFERLGVQGAFVPSVVDGDVSRLEINWK
jgi:uncharacterized protein (TIGR02265 family)